ncbi:enoyl-CoA hydratase [Burkholderia sp. BCC0419]|uniref:enoyl-CoA hydratase n=1 Tax=Burkholderia sp. BCC0419 TaxID=486878 RepID=UPI00158D959D|nr:enoyl-CoA hydratase [Burkholderia sp. BCC0419]
MNEFSTLTRDDRGVATLTIANAGKANILSSPVMDGLIKTLNELAKDESLKVLVLASNGENSFIGGADLKEMARLEAAEAEAFICRLKALCDAIRAFPTPVVARIQGWCLGGGLEVAASCDIRVAGSNANFAMPEVRMGIPSVIHAALLPRLMGRGRASWLMLVADSIDAKQALKWGLVEQVVNASQLDMAVDELVAKLVDSSACVLRTQKALLNQWDELPLSASVEVSIQSFRDSFETGEPTQFMNAFFERRKKRDASAS